MLQVNKYILVKKNTLKRTNITTISEASFSVTTNVIYYYIYEIKNCNSDIANVNINFTVVGDM